MQGTEGKLSLWVRAACSALLLASASIAAQPATDSDTITVVGFRPVPETVTSTPRSPWGGGGFGINFINGLDNLGANKSWQDLLLYSRPVDDLKSFSGKCEAKRGNPITITTGNKTESDTDFSTAEEKGLYLTRSWNQALGDRGLFGYNWTSNFDKKLIFRWENGSTCFASPGSPCATNPNSRLVQILAQRPDGRRIVVYQWGAPSPHNLYPITGSATGWTLKVDGEDVETYTAGGHITSETNRSGIGWTYTYGGTGGTWLQRVTHTNGRQVNFTWTGNRVATVTDPAGSSYNYAYTTSTATVTYPGTPATTLTYHFQSIATGNAYVGKSINGVRYSTFAYDANGRAISSEHAGGVEKSTFAYTTNSFGEVTQVVETNPLGKKATHSVALHRLMGTTGHASANCMATVRAYSYDFLGRYDVLVDNNGVTYDYDYNVHGQLLQYVEAAGTASERRTQYTWDTSPKNRLLSETRPGQWSRTHTYTAEGRLSTVTDKNLSTFGVANQTRTATYDYQNHPNGMLSRMTIAVPGEGTTTTNFTSYGELQSVVDPLGHVTTYSQFNAMGQPGRITGANGDITDLSYDLRGRVITATTYPSGVAATTTYTYNGNGTLGSMVLADGTARYYLYDGALRVVGEYVIRGPTGYDYKTLVRDTASNITAQYLGRSATIPTAGMTVGAVESQYFDYDELNRVRRIRGNNGQSLTYAYDGNGNVKSIKDALNRTTSYDYDPLNRVVTTTDAMMGITRTEYNGMGQVNKVTDPRLNATAYIFDGLGQLWAQASPDTGTTSYTYDAQGRQTGMTRADGATTTFGYDVAGRLTSLVSGAQSQTYSYDTCTNGKGRLCGTSSSGYNLHYEYSPVGNITSRREVASLGGTSTDFWTRYYYDSRGRLNAITYPDGAAVGYGYLYGQQTSMTLNVAGVVTNVITNTAYRPFAEASSWNFGNGVSRQLHYDQGYTAGDGRLTAVTAMNGPAALQHLRMAYDASDRLTSITNHVNVNLTQSFNQDALNRITGFNSGVGNQEFYYDANGNRTRHKWTWDETTTVDAGSNRITAAMSHVYTHNPVGNRTSHTWNGSTLTLAYDAFNRISSASRNVAVTMSEPNYGVSNLPAGVNTYSYNAFGERVYKSAPSHGEYRYVYAPGSKLLAEHKAGTGWTNYLWFDDTLVGLTRAGQTYFIHNDQVGRPEIVTNSTKAVVWRSNSYVFDRRVSVDAIGGLNVGYPGQYYDVETNLWYNHHRYYDAKLGRYLQSDPIGLQGGLNTYLYAGANPTLWIDPLGLQERTREFAATSGANGDRGSLGSSMFRDTLEQWGTSIRGVFYPPLCTMACAVEATIGVTKQSFLDNGKEFVGEKAVVAAGERMTKDITEACISKTAENIGSAVGKRIAPGVGIVMTAKDVWETGKCAMNCGP